MGKASQRKKSGREFEELITRIESNQLPAGAVVKSPDKLMDKVSGTLREVDASIRYKVGMSPILITIECRDRSRAAEQTWIEQIISKKNDIGANLTIGVSAKGFSKAARIKAGQYGILLRETQGMTATDLPGTSFQLHQVSIVLKKIRVHFQDIMQSPQLVVLSLDGSPFDRNKPFILALSTNQSVTFNEFLDHVLHRKIDNWPDSTKDDTEKSIVIELDPQTKAVRTQDGICSVIAIEIIFTGGLSKTSMQLAKGFKYISEKNETLAQFMDWSCNVTNSKGENVDIGVELILNNSNSVT